MIEGSRKGAFLFLYPPEPLFTRFLADITDFVEYS